MVAKSTILLLLVIPTLARAGAQQYETLTSSVRTALSASIADDRPPRLQIADIRQRLAYLEWLGRCRSD